jgi:hypothetical protein
MDSLLAHTDGPNQNHSGPGIATLAGVPARPDPELFNGLKLILHKPKFLGTDTPIYQLDMNTARYISGVPTTFHFVCADSDLNRAVAFPRMACRYRRHRLTFDLGDGWEQPPSGQGFGHAWVKTGISPRATGGGESPGLA